MAEDPVEPRIVEAVGVAVGYNELPGSLDRAKRIEAAMTEAVAQAQAEGLSDPDAVRERILAARDKAMTS